MESNRTFAPVLIGGTPNLGERIGNKINLLKQLQAAGVWLIDASIIALYDAGSRPSARVVRTTILNSWLMYTGDVVKSACPEHLIVVGKGVGKVLSAELESHFQGKYTVIPQPNAHLSSEQHIENFQKCFRICAGTGRQH